MVHTMPSFAYHKSQVQLFAVTERLVSNIATQILIRTCKFWTANKTQRKSCVRATLVDHKSHTVCRGNDCKPPR